MRRTAAYGHFGRAPEEDGGFSWERVDLVDAIESAPLSREPRMRARATARSSAGARARRSGRGSGRRSRQSFRSCCSTCRNRRPSALAALFPLPVDAMSARDRLRRRRASPPRGADAIPATGFIGVEPFENGLAKAVDGDRARGDPERPALRSGRRAAARLAAAVIGRRGSTCSSPIRGRRSGMEAPLRQARQISTASCACLRPAAASASRPTSKAMPTGRATRLPKHGGLEPARRRRGSGAVGGLAGHALRGEGSAAGRGAAYLTFRKPARAQSVSAWLADEDRARRRPARSHAPRPRRRWQAPPARPHARRPGERRRNRQCTGRSVRITPARRRRRIDIGDRHAEKPFARGEPEQARSAARSPMPVTSRAARSDAAAPDAKPAAAAGEDRPGIEDEQQQIHVGKGVHPLPSDDARQSPRRPSSADFLPQETRALHQSEPAR